jgi:hypothetical protein
MQYRVSQQVVTGLTVNKKVNIRASYFREARSMCRALFNDGQFERVRAKGGVPAKLGSMNQLEGILNYIYFARNWEKSRSSASDPVEIEKKKKLEKQKEQDRREEVVPRHGANLLYERFLFFKKFVMLDKPLILCEGKTDGIYLRSAIKQSPAYLGTLSTVASGKNICSVEFFRYSRLTNKLLELGGGSDNLGKLILRYDDFLKTFKHQPLRHPVILLIDNDDGAGDVFGPMKKIHVTASLNTVQDFYELTRNLYLVKTLETGAGGHSSIEDCFDAATLAKTINGKKFNRAKKIDPSTEYGKKIFAENIIAPNAATINFNGFAPLLNRITAVIAHHAARVAAGPI